MKKIIRYHGSYNRDIKEFNLDYLEKGEHQDGVGIYFTLNKKDIIKVFINCVRTAWERWIYRN